MVTNYIRLGVNIDHVATIRNARGSIHPDPIKAAKIAQFSGADGITAHLREDRRHISDDDIKKLLGGLLSPDITEKITGNVEIREVFNISKVGNIAGCIVKDGFILRKSQIRILRDNVVIHTGGISSLKRFKDEVKEVKNGYECGVMIENYPDIKVGDIIETFEEIKTNRTL